MKQGKHRKLGQFPGEWSSFKAYPSGLKACALSIGPAPPGFLLESLMWSAGITEHH